MALTTKYNLPDNLVAEWTEYDRLYRLGNSRSLSGSLSFTSPSSGVSYSSTTGQQGILQSLQTALGIYLISAEDYNAISVDLTALKADVAPSKNRGGLVFGQEYLSSFHKKIKSWSTTGSTLFKAVFSGDSTTAGDSTSGVSYHIDQLIKDAALKSGFPMLSVVNNGQSGKDTEHWNQTYYNTDLTALPDILILRWGINDPYYKHSDNSILPDQSTENPAIDALRRTAADFEASLRSGLTKIRTSKSLSQLSIILMVPNSVNDTPNGRDQEWIESIVPAIQKAARDFQCCFINTYQFLQDSVNAADWMDNPYGDGRHIHPNDVMNLWISGLLADVMFPKGLIGNLAKNNLVNDWNGNTIKSVAALPNTYAYGISLHRTTDAPLNGTFITFRSTDEIVTQMNHSYVAGNNSFSIRKGLSSTNVWDSWVSIDSSISTPIRPSLQNSWVDYLPASGSQVEHYKESNGIVHVQGLIKNGTTTANTILFTLPAASRPVIDRFFPVATNTGFGVVTISADGTVRIQSGGNGYLSFDGIHFRTT